MRVQKWELANGIKKLRAVVPKQTTVPALQNILVENGRLTATNLELTVSTALQGSEGETMLIPAKAFGLIDSLPNGEIEIKSVKDRLMISSASIRNTFMAQEPDDFPRTADAGAGGAEATISGTQLASALKNVLYAIPKQSSQQAMTAVCMECDGSELSFAGLNGHQAAWFTIPYQGNFKMLVPRSAAEQLIGLGLEGSVQITYSESTAVFRSEDYTVQTRLIDGQFFQYRKPFALDGDRVDIPRQMFLNAVRRADMCNDAGDPKPVRIALEGDGMKVFIQTGTAAYSEDVPLSGTVAEPMTIGFNPALLKTTLESFSDERIKVLFLGPKLPMIATSADGALKGLLLPVLVR